MNVANEELCKKLYHLSGWGKGETRFVWHCGGLNLLGNIPEGDAYCPAYPLDYLIRKIPKSAITRVDQNNFENPTYYADSFLLQDRKGIARRFEADTPENATARLAIELFKQGILPTPQTIKQEEK